MVVVAIAVKGHEYLYSAKTAHKVNAKKAVRIAEILNAVMHGLHCKQETRNKSKYPLPLQHNAGGGGRKTGKRDKIAGGHGRDHWKRREAA